MFKTACVYLAYVAAGAPEDVYFTGDESQREGLLRYSDRHVPGQTRWYHWNKGQVLWALLALACLLVALAFCCTRTNPRDERPVVYVQPQTRVAAPPAPAPIQGVRSDVVNYV